MIVREYNDFPSNFRSVMTLSEVMKKHGIVGISGIDTRKLTRSIRDHGSRKVLLTDVAMPLEEGLCILAESPMPSGEVARVSCKGMWYAKVPDGKYRVVAVDCGMKHNIIRSLNHRGCDVIVVPWDTPAEQIKKLLPDGVFLSNGPGNPEEVQPVIETVRKLRGQIPVFGICLGHQVISLAYGAKTYKMKFGHRGGNHPVRNLETNKIEITSQNHSYAVEEESLKQTDLTVTHVNLLDGTVEGVKCERDHVFSVQYHPESAPGPQDSGYLFDIFIKMMEEEK